jgi:hypothetical protein
MKQIYNNLYKDNVKGLIDFPNFRDYIQYLWLSQKPYDTLSSKDNTNGVRNFVLSPTSPDKNKVLSDIYNLFLNKVNSVFKEYSVHKDNKRDVWVYCSDKRYSDTGIHDHKETATINGVIYVKTVKNCGIKFYVPDEVYEEPSDCDIYIFPGDMAHDPLPSNNEMRISINVELKCNESIRDLFDPKNIRENF